MDQRIGYMKTTIILLFVIVIMIPVASFMSVNMPKDKSEIIFKALICQRDHLSSKSAVEVKPVMEIEEIWEIEDTRTEAEDLLVHTMYCGEYELGFDEQSNTFYCTLGKNGEEWPQISLYASGTDELQVGWVDDYAFDSCAEAIREGYQYELFAYTNEKYSYFNLVFTGLPIVTLHVDEGMHIERKDVPARVTVFGQGFSAIDSAALVHVRGGGMPTPIDKASYRIEFYDVEGSGRDKKAKIDVLGMEADSDWLLLANASDESAVRNYLAFDFWKRWNPDGALTMLENRMVELFVNNEYVGMYQVMQRVLPEREIMKAGGDIETDAVIRVITSDNASDRPVKNLVNEMNYCVEYRYEPHGKAEKAFKNLETYILLNQNAEIVDDQIFSDLVSRHVDVENMMSYYLFLQAAITTSDNVNNNHYIWMFWEDGQFVYRLSPWDMDRAFSGTFLEDGSLQIKLSRAPIVAARMLDLDIMESRNTLHRIWTEKRKTILAEDALEEWLMDVEEEINGSGAYLRESEKWYGTAQELNLKERLYILNNQMQVIQDFLDYMWPISGENKSGFTEEGA